MRGGERCLEAFCEIFPEAPIYTLVHIPGSTSQKIEQHKIIPSFLNSIPLVKKNYPYFLPLFPWAIRSFNLHGFDLILSSSHCVAKGISVPNGTFHISYVHTPMRYVWDRYEDYVTQENRFQLKNLAFYFIRKRLQRWDVKSNAHVHCFIANSHYVAQRIKQHYARTATVIYPPVDWNSYRLSSHKEEEGFYLIVSAFVPYKRVDLAIKASNSMKFPLKIIGKGKDETRLKKIAGSTVEFLGWQPDHRVRQIYRQCRAVIFPGEEDFGIVPLEAMACGKPVIAYGKGGVLETVVPYNPLHPIESNKSPTGVFFFQQTPESLCAAIKVFEKKENEFSPHAIREQAKPFDRLYFIKNLRSAIKKNYDLFTSPPK